MNETNPEENADFFRKPKKILFDPVIDPRESWESWSLRVINFQNPPLIERSQLDESLQPQNRIMGTIHHYL